VAGIEPLWSNSQTKGQICRLETLKCQMRARANIDLLRARMMCGA
jgi:transposase